MQPQHKNSTDTKSFQMPTCPLNDFSWIFNVSTFENINKNWGINAASKPTDPLETVLDLIQSPTCQMGRFLNPAVLCHGSIWWRSDIVTAAARDLNVMAGVIVRVCSVQLANTNLVVEFFKKEIKNSNYVGKQDFSVTKFAPLIRTNAWSWVAPPSRFFTRTSTTLCLFYIFIIMVIFIIIIVLITWMILVNEIKGVIIC